MVTRSVEQLITEAERAQQREKDQAGTVEQEEKMVQKEKGLTRVGKPPLKKRSISNNDRESQDLTQKSKLQEDVTEDDG